MPGKFCGLNMHHLQREEGMSHSSLQQLERIFAHKFQEVAFACLQVIIHRKAQFIIKVTVHPSSQKDKRLPITFAHLYSTTATLKRSSWPFALDTEVSKVILGRESIFTGIPVLALS